MFDIYLHSRGARGHAVVIVNDPFSDLPFFGSEESMWSEITDPFLDPSKKRTKRQKATTSSALVYSPQVNKIPPHFIHEIKTKGYDVIGVNVFRPAS